MTRLRIVVPIAVCLLLAACTVGPAPSPTPTPTPTPEPTYSCTPEAGGAAYECSAFDYEQMVAKDKLYAEAEAVYRKFFAEDERIYRAGGVDEPTPVLLETTTGKFLEDSMRIYRALKKNETHLEGQPAGLSWIRRVPGAQSAGSVVAMQTCTDASKSLMVTPGRPNESAGYLSDLVYFGRDGDALKIMSARGDVVKTCAG